MAKSVWRRNDLIYMPRKKKVISGTSVGALGAYAVEHTTLKSQISNAHLITFWTTPRPNRTSSAPPLQLYDPVTSQYQEVNYSSSWSSTSHRLYAFMGRLNYTATNVTNTIWEDAHHWWSNVSMPVIFLYVNFTNADNHLYKISSPDIQSTYRMTPHSTSYTLANNNGSVYGVYADGARYSSLLNNQTVQNTIAGHNIYGSMVIYLQEDVSDSVILNLCEVYAMPGVSQVESLTI